MFDYKILVHENLLVPSSTRSDFIETRYRPRPCRPRLCAGEIATRLVVEIQFLSSRLPEPYFAVCEALDAELAVVTSRSHLET